MQTNLPFPLAHLNSSTTHDAPNTNPYIVSFAAISSAPGAGVGAAMPPSGPLKRKLDELDDPSLPPLQPPATINAQQQQQTTTISSVVGRKKKLLAPLGPPTAVEKGVRSAAHPVQNAGMLPGPLPNPRTVTPVDDYDTVLRSLRVGAMLAQSRTRTGHLALGMCRLQVEHKAATGEELFPQEHFDAYLDSIDRCIFPSFGQMNGVVDGDVPTEALLGYIYAATLGDVGDLSGTSSTSELGAEPSTTSARFPRGDPEARADALIDQQDEDEDVDEDMDEDEDEDVGADADVDEDEDENEDEDNDEDEDEDKDE